MTEEAQEISNILHSPEWPINFYDVAMAFGQGPVDGENSKVNTWARTTAVAMGYLALKTQFREAVWSGGRTGGEAFPSEAELMQQTMYQVFGAELLEEKNDHLEFRSKNTLENFVHSLNMLDRLSEKDIRPFERMVFVCSDFHATRIKFMASLFNIHTVDVLSSEQIIKIMITDPTIDDAIIEKAADALIEKRDTSVSARSAIGKWINQRIDPNNVGLNREEGDFQSFIGGGERVQEHAKGFTPFEKAQEDHPGSPEGISHTNRMKNEDMFIEGLATMPANWLGFIADIEDDRRFKGIIDNLLSISESFFEDLDIIPRAPLSELRQKLLPYKKDLRKFVSLVHTTYNSKDTPKAVQAILNHREQKKKYL